MVFPFVFFILWYCLLGYSFTISVIKERGGVCIYSESQTRPPEKTFVSTGPTLCGHMLCASRLLCPGHSGHPWREQLAQPVCEGPVSSLGPRAWRWPRGVQVLWDLLWTFAAGKMSYSSWQSSCPFYLEWLFFPIMKKAITVPRPFTSMSVTLSDMKRAVHDWHFSYCS